VDKKLTIIQCVLIHNCSTYKKYVIQVKGVVFLFIKYLI